MTAEEQSSSLEEIVIDMTREEALTVQSCTLMEGASLSQTMRNRFARRDATHEGAMPVSVQIVVPSTRVAFGSQTL